MGDKEGEGERMEFTSFLHILIIFVLSSSICVFMDVVLPA